LNLRKAFENRQDRLWPAFKISKLALAGFKIGELALASFQNWRLASGWLSKSASWLWPAFKDYLLSNRSKGFELAGFQKLFANSNAFRAKRLRIN
jgi:hypothetical protein